MFLFQKGLIIKILHILKYFYISKRQIGMVAHIPQSREIKDLLSFLKRFTKIIVTFKKSKPLMARRTDALTSL